MKSQNMPKGGIRSSHSFCLEPQIILLGLGQDRQTVRLLCLALPAFTKKLCLVGESRVVALHLLPKPVWKEAASGGWCSTLCYCELCICVKRWQSGDLVASFLVPPHVSQVLFKKYIAIQLKTNVVLACTTM